MSPLQIEILQPSTDHCAAWCFRSLCSLVILMIEQPGGAHQSVSSDGRCSLGFKGLGSWRMYTVMIRKRLVRTHESGSRNDDETQGTMFSRSLSLLITHNIHYSWCDSFACTLSTAHQSELPCFPSTRALVAKGSNSFLVSWVTLI
jgi:hypothetical protein